MDITTKRVSDTAAIHVKDADGVPMFDGEKPVRIIIHGPGSKAFSTVETRQTNRALKRMNENDGKVSAATADERKREQAEDLAAITVRFDNISYEDKEGADLFEAVYSDPGLGFIPAQVTKFLGDWGNFKSGSPTS